MNDRTLLELAAKAAGYDVLFDVSDSIAGRWVSGGDGRIFWNPLIEDGDALRLADKLNMAVFFSVSGKTAEAPDGPGPVWEETDYRRAIVRAAAEIGSQMK